MKGTYGDYRGAILDFDMTLVNLFDFVDQFALRSELREVLSRNGFMIDGMRNLPVGLLRNAYGRDGGEEQTRRKRWQEASDIICRYELAAAGVAIPTRDTVGFLEELKLAGVSMALVSSNCEDAIRRCVSRLGMEDYFECIVGRNTVMWEMKPSPLGTKIAIDRLGVSPVECFGVGDSASDIRSYTGAEVYPVGITGGVSTRAELLDAGARAVVTRLSEVRSAVVHETRYTSSVSES